MIVLDTHAWLWWRVAPERLSGTASRAIEEALDVGVSTVCCWEIALLVAHGRIALDAPVERWVEEALRSDPRIRTLPLEPAVAVRSALLGSDGFHGDPADRFLYATARSLDAPLVTRDRAIRAFDPANTVW